MTWKSEELQLREEFLRSHPGADTVLPIRLSVFCSSLLGVYPRLGLACMWPGDTGVRSTYHFLIKQQNEVTENGCGASGWLICRTRKCTFSSKPCLPQATFDSLLRCSSILHHLAEIKIQSGDTAVYMSRVKVHLTVGQKTYIHPQHMPPPHMCGQ